MSVPRDGEVLECRLWEVLAVVWGSPGAFVPGVALGSCARPGSCPQPGALPGQGCAAFVAQPVPALPGAPAVAQQQRAGLQCSWKLFSQLFLRAERHFSCSLTFQCFLWLD